MYNYIKYLTILSISLLMLIPISIAQHANVMHVGTLRMNTSTVNTNCYTSTTNLFSTQSLAGDISWGFNIDYWAIYFTASSDATLCTVVIPLKKSGVDTLTGEMKVAIFYADFNPNITTNMSGWSNPLYKTNLTESFINYNFTIPDFQLVAGTPYFLVVWDDTPTQDGGNKSVWGGTNSPGTHTLKYYQNYGQNWADDYSVNATLGLK